MTSHQSRKTKFFYFCRPLLSDVETRVRAELTTAMTKHLGRDVTTWPFIAASQLFNPIDLGHSQKRASYYGDIDWLVTDPQSAQRPLLVGIQKDNPFGRDLLNLAKEYGYAALTLPPSTSDLELVLNEVMSGVEINVAERAGTLMNRAELDLLATLCQGVPEYVQDVELFPQIPCRKIIEKQPDCVEDPPRFKFVGTLSPSIPTWYITQGERDEWLRRYRNADPIDFEEIDEYREKAVFDITVCGRDRSGSAIPLLVIEFDGQSHRSLHSKHKDEMKNFICYSAGLPLVRVRSDDWLRNENKRLYILKSDERRRLVCSFIRSVVSMQAALPLVVPTHITQLSDDELACLEALLEDDVNERMDGIAKDFFGRPTFSIQRVGSDDSSIQVRGKLTGVDRITRQEKESVTVGLRLEGSLCGTLPIWKVVEHAVKMHLIDDLEKEWTIL